MEGPHTPKNPRLTSIQLDSELGRTPSYPTTHYTSSTNIADAKTNLKTTLATRVSFNDPNIVDVLIKPDEVGDDFVKNIKDDILKDRDIYRSSVHAVRCRRAMSPSWAANRLSVVPSAGLGPSQRSRLTSSKTAK